MRRSKVLEKIRNGKVARICNVGHYLPYAPMQAALAGFDANTGNTVIDAQSIAPALPRGLASLTTLGDDGDTQTVWQVGQATTTTPVIRSGTTTGTSGNSGTGGDGAGSGGDGAGSGGGGAGGGGSGGGDSSSLEMAPSTYTTAGLGADIKFG